MMPKNFYIIVILFLLISSDYASAQGNATLEVSADEAKNAAGEQKSAGDASKAVSGESKNMSTGGAVSKEVPVSEEEKQKTLKKNLKMPSLMKLLLKVPALNLLRMI